jgi:hypothetical protein
MRRVGVSKARVVIGVDFTASNEWQGGGGKKPVFFGAPIPGK